VDIGILIDTDGYLLILEEDVGCALFAEARIDMGSPAFATAADTEQAEVVWDIEEVADSVESPFLYLIVYEYEVLQVRPVSVQELVVIQPELLELVVFVK